MNFFPYVAGLTRRRGLDVASEHVPAQIKRYVISLIEPVEGATVSEGQMMTISSDAVELPNPTNPLEIQQTDILHFLGHGQSLAAGADSRPIISVENVGGNLLVKPEEPNWFTYDPEGLDTLVPMEFPRVVENWEAIHRETPMTGWANGFKAGLARELPDHPLNSSVVLGSVTSLGGSPIEPMMKGGSSRVYEDAYLKMVQAGKDAALAAGKTISCPALFFMQGESEPETTTYDLYLQRLMTLITDMRTDAAVAYGHPDKLPTVFVYQPKTAPAAVKRAYEYIIKEYNWVVGIGALHHVPNVTVHLDPNGSRWTGEQYAKATIQMLKTNQKYQPLIILKTEVVGNKVILTFNKNIVEHDLPMEWAGSVPTLFGITTEVISINRNRMVLGTTNLNLKDAGDLFIDFTESRIRDEDDYLSTTLYEDYIRRKANTNDYKDANGNIIYGQPYPMYNWLLDYRGYQIQ